jgi:hypothetical protein
MFGIPFKTRLPLEAWAVVAVLTLIWALSSLINGPAVSVATHTPPPVERSANVVKASLAGGHSTRTGSGIYSE